MTKQLNSFKDSPKENRQGYPELWIVFLNVKTLTPQLSTIEDVDESDETYQSQTNTSWQEIRLDLNRTEPKNEPSLPLVRLPCLDGMISNCGGTCSSDDPKRRPEKEWDPLLIIGRKESKAYSQLFC